MKVILLATLLSFIPTLSSAGHPDPMGLSDYVITERNNVPHQKGVTGIYHQDRRLTNHEVDLFKGTGLILADGSINPNGNMIHYQPAQASSSQQPVDPNKISIKNKPLPTSKQIAKQTGTKHIGHPLSNGTVHVRPTKMPANPSRDDIVRMQHHIQHIERQVARALDLSLSAYAVAELPQATDGRSSVSFGVAANNGQVAEAVGYSSNFGAKHEYTIKVNLTHSGSENAVGAGVSYQW